MEDNVFRVYRIDVLKNTVTPICYSRMLESVLRTYGKRMRWTGRYIFYIREEPINAESIYI